MFDGEHRFLHGDPINWNKVAFTSYPRSGNSFLRKIIENVTGVVTGCVMRYNITRLQIMGFKGEGIVNDTTWIVKAHHPLLSPKCLAFTGYKTFVIVRNPLDVFPSFAGMHNTLTHSAKP